MCDVARNLTLIAALRDRNKGSMKSVYIFALYGLVLCLLLPVITSCVHLPADILSHKDMSHRSLEAYFPEDDTTLSDSIQPLEVMCPVCKSSGSYIQSIYVYSALPGAMNILYSQYVCTNSHEWLIGQKTVGGAVLPGK